MRPSDVLGRQELTSFVHVFWLQRLGGDVIAYSAADVQIFKDSSILDLDRLQDVSSRQDGMGCALVNVDSCDRDPGPVNSSSLRWFSG